MAPSPNTIEYVVQAAGRDALTFAVDVDRPPRRGALPVWTELAQSRCEGCPLEASHCPAAADLAPVIDALKDVFSVERVVVTVRWSGRELRKETDSQELVRSLVGLILASSACPILSRMKPLAALHQPFASFDETLFRAVGLHLIRAFLDKTDGRDADFALDDLRRHYDDVARVNRGLAKRVRSLGAGDAGVNGLINLFSMGMLVSDQLEDRLEGLRALVSPAAVQG